MYDWISLHEHFLEAEVQEAVTDCRKTHQKKKKKKKLEKITKGNNPNIMKGSHHSCILHSSSTSMKFQVDTLNTL